MEARDPITEPGAPLGAGAPKPTAAERGRERREKGPGVKKREGSVLTADQGGNPEVASGGGRSEDQPIRSETAPGAEADVDAFSSSPRMNQPSARPGIPKDGPRPPEA